MIGFGKYSNFTISTNLTSSLKSDESAGATFLLPALHDVQASPGVWVIALLVFVLVAMRVVGIFVLLCVFLNFAANCLIYSLSN